MPPLSYQTKEKIPYPNIFENFVANELVAKEHHLFYWRGRTSCELEFIVESNNKLYPIDVKKAEELSILLKNFQIIINLNLLLRSQRIITVIIQIRNYSLSHFILCHLLQKTLLMGQSQYKIYLPQPHFPE